MIYALFITYASGYTSVHTFSTECARSAEMALLRVQPVTLRTQDYAGGGDPS